MQASKSNVTWNATSQFYRRAFNSNFDAYGSTYIEACIPIPDQSHIMERREPEEGNNNVRRLDAILQMIKDKIAAASIAEVLDSSTYSMGQVPRVMPQHEQTSTYPSME